MTQTLYKTFPCRSCGRSMVLDYRSNRRDCDRCRAPEAAESVKVVRVTIKKKLFGRGFDALDYKGRKLAWGATLDEVKGCVNGAKRFRNARVFFVVEKS